MDRFWKGIGIAESRRQRRMAITISTLSGTGFFGGDWGADNTIVFVPDYNGGLWTVSANGGTPQPLLKTDVERIACRYSDPQILPGGKGVLFTLASGSAVIADDQDVAVLEPGGTESRILIRGASHPRYLPTGQVVYVHGGALLAVKFDLSTLAVTGTPVSVIEGLGKTWSGDTDYSISNNGTVVYQADAGLKAGGSFRARRSQGKRPAGVNQAWQLLRVFHFTQRPIARDARLCRQRRHLDVQHRERCTAPVHLRTAG